jgi:uncharacterized protein DUF1573
MKKLVILLIATTALFACQSTDKKTVAANGSEPVSGTTTTDVTTIQWLDSTTVDMGKIKEGQVMEVSFRFKNSGDKNLVIENVKASCGCTVPEKPEKPIAPGEESIIKAKFDSRGKPGSQHKTITVSANTPEAEYNLSFSVIVETE